MCTAGTAALATQLGLSIQTRRLARSKGWVRWHGRPRSPGEGKMLLCVCSPRCSLHTRREPCGTHALLRTAHVARQHYRRAVRRCDTMVNCYSRSSFRCDRAEETMCRYPYSMIEVGAGESQTHNSSCEVLPIGKGVIFSLFWCF